MKPIKIRKAGSFSKKRKGKKISEEDRKKNAARWLVERRLL